MDILQEIADERARQQTAEGFDHGHDDRHAKGELALAAACYAQHAGISSKLAVEGLSEDRIAAWSCADGPPPIWPWHFDWWRPGRRRRTLIKAAALIVAEIERLDRAGQQ